MADISEERLLPCPFCDGEPLLHDDAPPTMKYVSCTSCKATSDDGSRERVIAAWNRRRAVPADVEGAIEAFATLTTKYAVTRRHSLDERALGPKVIDAHAHVLSTIS